MQNDTKAANLRAMTEATREYGGYSDGHAPAPGPVGRAVATDVQPIGRTTRNAPGVCQPWESQKPQMPPISGDEGLARRIWQQVDALATMYIWQLLLSF
jgi:hypothetical protein